MENRKIIPCKLSELKHGDKVLIRHFSPYLDGFLKSDRKYKYLHVYNGVYAFERIPYSPERFHMKVEKEELNTFLGKI